MIELLIAFGAGLISFLSPCVLPLIPGYISFITGNSLNELLESKNSEREGRAIDKDQIGSMEKKKQEGYF